MTAPAVVAGPLKPPADAAVVHRAGVVTASLRVAAPVAVAPAMASEGRVLATATAPSVALGGFGTPGGTR